MVVQIDPSELPVFDKREAGYQRVPLDRQAIIFGDVDVSALAEDTDFWIYTHPPGEPSPSHPVLKSYLDVNRHMHSTAYVCPWFNLAFLVHSHPLHMSSLYVFVVPSWR